MTAVLKQFEGKPMIASKQLCACGSMQMKGPIPGSVAVQPMATGGMPGPMPMPGGGTPVMAGHGLDLTDVPPEIANFLVTLDELAHAPQPFPPREGALHVPLFLHQLSGL